MPLHGWSSTRKPADRRPVPIRGPNQGWNLIDFKDPKGKSPHQLLVATSEGAMRLQGDSLVPAMPAVHGLTEQTYVIDQSVKDPSRIFIGHSDGVGSMRWDGQKWIDEGRLPKTIYEARGIVEDADGVLWVSGGSRSVLRVEVAASGMRDSKYQVFSQNEGLPEGQNDVELVAGSIFATVDRSKHIFRWDPAAAKFVIDDRFLLPIDAPDVGSSLGLYDAEYQGPNAKFWSATISSETRRLGLFSRQADGTWHVDEDSYRRLNRFRTFSSFHDPDGVLWITGEHVLRLAPVKGQAAAPPFPTLVRQVSAGSNIVFGGSKSEGASELHLPPATTALRFQFAALNYADPLETEYQYWLEGADKDWSVWGKQKEANYSGLGPGTYRFHVRSRADDGRSGEEAIYAFDILPPWYRTTLAYICYVLLFLFLTYVAWRWVSIYEREKARRKTRILEEQARALEATVSERTQEIRAQAAEIAAQKDSIELLSEIGREITASLDLNTILFKLYRTRKSDRRCKHFWSRSLSARAASD